MTTVVAHRRAPMLALPLRALRLLFDLTVGGLLCLTPVTAVLAMGFIVRRMHLAATGTAERTGWLMGSAGEGALTRLLGGLVANIREGVSASVSLLAVTLPFSFPWLLAWWAGWDNSFNKGYEQAFAGPALFLAGIAVFLVVMIHLPMALAHQAATGRWLAMLEWRPVRRAVRHAGWGYVALALATVFFALPLFAARGLPVFVEQIIPGFADFTPDRVEAVRGTAALAVAIYVFTSYWWFRTWAGRTYAAAMARAEAAKGRWLAGRGLRLAALSAIWGGLVVLIVVGQFLHHSWWAWAQHPAFLLPWYR